MKSGERVAAAREPGDAPWTAHIRRMDDALANGDVSLAIRAWQQAYGAALVSSRWEGLVEVGDSLLRIGQTTKLAQASTTIARSAYVTALFRAREDGSLDGVLRATEAFAALGDREVVASSIRIAEDLAASADSQARQRVRELAERLGSQPLETRKGDLEIF